MPELKIGSIAWLRETSGKLTLKSRLSLLSEVLVPSMSTFLKMKVQSGRNKPLSLEDISIPDSQAVKHAVEALEHCADDSIVQHSFRTYFWGAGLGQIETLNFDPEFLLVGSLLHDLGMTEHHRSNTCQCFAGDSAIAAANTMQQVGWPEPKVEALADMICLHMNGHVDTSEGIEAHLLQQAAAYDIIGSRFYDLHANYRQAVLSKHPRVGINQTFTRFIAKEKKDNPASRAALMHRVGLPLMIKLNPYPE